MERCARQGDLESMPAQKTNLKAKETALERFLINIRRIREAGYVGRYER
jgi:hypothetical protein